MKPIKVRNVKIGEGIPKICVPIVGKTKEDILAEAAAAKRLPLDMIEWRADWYEDVFETDQVIDTAKNLREILGDIPVLFTFRTAAEGGKKAIRAADYSALNLAAAASGYVDLVDVEAFTGDEIVAPLIKELHQTGVKTVASNHDFGQTPPKDELVKRLCKMQDLGADIAKIAVMPQSKKDVLVLLEATLEMTEQYAKGPVITMSMAGDGVISRMCGETFGSALTFGAAGRASAPGQIQAEDLAEVLRVMHGGGK